MLWLNSSKFELRHPKDQTSIILFGAAITLILAIELFSSNYIAKNIFQISSPMHYVAAFLWAMIIYIIDVSIIRTQSKKFATVIRVVIAIIISVIGFFTVDSLLFQKEIDAQLRENAKLKVVKYYDTLIKDQKNEVSFRDQDYLTKVKIANEEAEGNSKTGRIGVGAVYKVKKETADVAFQELLSSKQKLNKIEEEKKNDILISSTTAIKEAGFSEIVKAHLQYVSGDIISLCIGIIFSILLLAIQFQVLLVKWSVGPLIEDQINDAKGEKTRIDIDNKRKIDASPLAILDGIMEPASGVLHDNNS
jgi:hypothetical protein